MNKFTTWLDTHLVSEWRSAWKLFSIQWAAFGTVVTSVWAALDDSQRAIVLSWFGIDAKWLVPAGILIAIYLRLKKQGDQ